MNKASFYIPLAVFALIIVSFVLGFGLGNRSELPSALIDKPFPEFSAPDLFRPDQVLSREQIVGRPALVNVWATWCPTCAAEHEMLIKITERADVRLIGINYKDDPDKAIAWLGQFGNPYDLVLVDDQGLLGVELGVYGAPETFLLDPSGAIVYKRVGDVNERIWQQEIKPRLIAMSPDVVHGIDAASR
ncbi:MAG: DsbE family thiol:disulfide interchange protein [Pseudomonadales bacterium]|nr:DsbE family thiol:disulfide interchange protein [Pseudomonadales bacterium]